MWTGNVVRRGYSEHVLAIARPSLVPSLLLFPSVEGFLRCLAHLRIGVLAELQQEREGPRVL